MQIYVNNLPLTTTADELRHLFAPYGTIETARIVTDRSTGRPRGYSFVEMPYATEAQAAIARLDRTSLGGQTLRASSTRPREERRPRGEHQGWPRW
jgi:RNA recognition motif-containing protein